MVNKPLKSRHEFMKIKSIITHTNTHKSIQHSISIIYNIHIQLRHFNLSTQILLRLHWIHSYPHSKTQTRSYRSLQRTKNRLRCTICPNRSNNPSSPRPHTWQISYKTQHQFLTISPQFCMAVCIPIFRFDLIQICPDAPASDSRGTKIYDLLVICLLPLSVILPTSSVELLLVIFLQQHAWTILTRILCGIVLYELQQNLYNSKSSLLPDTSPSFSPELSLSKSLWFTPVEPFEHSCSTLLQFYHLPLLLPSQKIKITGLTKLHKTVPLLSLYANFFSTGSHFPALIPLDEERNPL